jgi:hypothetical protein
VVCLRITSNRGTARSESSKIDRDPKTELFRTLNKLPVWHPIYTLRLLSHHTLAYGQSHNKNKDHFKTDKLIINFGRFSHNLNLMFLMRSVFFFALLSLILHVNLKAQAPDQSLPSGLKPRVGVTVLSDGKPTNQQTGAKIGTKEIRFKALLDTKSNDFFYDFQSEVLIKNAEVILARNGRRIAQVDVTGGRLFADFVQQAQPADQIIVRFTLMAQRKNGELILFPEKPVYNFPIRE